MKIVTPVEKPQDNQDVCGAANPTNAFTSNMSDEEFEGGQVETDTKVSSFLVCQRPLAIGN